MLISVMEEVNRCIQTLYEKNHNPNELTIMDLLFVPKAFLIYYYRHNISSIVNKLPLHLQADEELRLYLRCNRHNTGPDQFDGPNPYRINCRSCRPNLKVRSRTLTREGTSDVYRKMCILLCRGM